MFKKAMMGLTAAIFLFTSAGIAAAMEKGSDRKGKYTYRKVYKACMERGEVQTDKPPISPDAKTQAQWTRLFDKKDFEEFGCKTEWDNLSEADLMDIFAYLHGHAADSPSPAKCK